MTKAQFRHYCGRAQADHIMISYTGDWQAHHIASSVVGIMEKAVQDVGPKLLWDPRSLVGNPLVYKHGAIEPEESGMAAVYTFEEMTCTDTSEKMGVELLLGETIRGRVPVSLRNVTISFDGSTPILTLDLWVEDKLVGMDHQFRTDSIPSTARCILDQVNCRVSECTGFLDDLHAAAAANDYNRCPDLTRYL